MVYPVSCTAVCYVTVITLFIKKVGVVHPNFGGPDPLNPQWLRPWVFAALTIVTDVHATPSVTIGRIFVSTVLRCGLIMAALRSRCGHYIFIMWFLMVALCNRADHYILPCGFFLLLSSFFFSSPNLSGRRLDVYHTSTHGVALVRI